MAEKLIYLKELFDSSKFRIMDTFNIFEPGIYYIPISDNSDKPEGAPPGYSTQQGMQF